MTYERAVPCRHKSAPPGDVVHLVTKLLEIGLVQESDVLRRHGLSSDEYESAFPAAIEALRGRWAASNRRRRDFLELIVAHLAAGKHVASYDLPDYGDDTVYRLILPTGKKVGIIQKGCPDGAHSSINWTRPEWADELYLWWVCSSLNHQPGDHIWKGVRRVTRKVADEPVNQLDGLVFFSSECGSADRPCPKITRAIEIGGTRLPPPCVYVFPHWDGTKSELNWRGDETRIFPRLLLTAFSIRSTELTDYTGYVGFRAPNAITPKTEITSRFGPGKSTTARG